jgi:hypothetical protein
MHNDETLVLGRYDMDDNDALDDAKRRFLSAKADIDRLRQKIAEASCPLKIGDRVAVRDGEHTYEGTVDHIGAAPGLEDLFMPEVGAPTPWSASGKRIRKGDGGQSKWGFAIPADAELINGIWHMPKRSIERTLGLE